MNFLEIVGFIAIVIFVVLSAIIIISYIKIGKLGVARRFADVSLNLHNLMQNGKDGDFVIFNMRNHDQFIQFRKISDDKQNGGILELSLPENDVTKSYVNSVVSILTDDNHVISRKVEYFDDDKMYFNYVNFGKDIEKAKVFCFKVFRDVFNVSESDKIYVRAHITNKFGS